MSSTEPNDKPAPPYDWLPMRITLTMTDFEAGALAGMLMALVGGALSPTLQDMPEYRPDENGEPRATTIGHELLDRLNKIISER